MTEFFSPTDIGNRALQHVGAEMMDATLGFDEVSKNAQQVSFAYGKLRRAELRRNVWRFATRRAVLRPIDTNTLMLSPNSWDAGTTYFTGSIVADASNNLWISRIPNNIDNAVTDAVSWEPYFGPLSVTLYDSTKSYFSGELVYTAAGDGTYNTYLSLVNSNALHPALPNQWSVNTVYFKNQVVQVFPAYSSVTTYTKGQTVVDGGGNTFSSLVSANLNHTPSTSTAQWALMPVLTLSSVPAPVVTPLPTPLTSSPVIEWAESTTYGLGAFVMFNATEYLSILASNTGNFPNAAASTFWTAVTGGTLYMSLINLNLGNNPASLPQLWLVGTTYAINALVVASDGFIYTSVAGGNVGHNPVGDAGVHWTKTVLPIWTPVFTQGGGNQQWMQIGGASFPTGVGLAGFNITYPVAAGPASQASTRNVYRLPSGYLRTAPSDPKAGSVSFLGAPSGLQYTDWIYEGDFIVTREVDPITLRFVADMVDVIRMDDMFCEGLAARIAVGVCEPLTQSTTKIGIIEKEYMKIMTEARTVNGIETGATEPPLDDYLTARY